MDNPPNPFMGTPRPGEVDVVGLVGAPRMIRGFLFFNPQFRLCFDFKNF